MTRHLGVGLRMTIVTIVLLGLLYPIAMTGLAQLVFPFQANGSLVYRNGRLSGSQIVGQLWTQARYFHGRPSAAGKGYDPTATGGTNLGASSKKLIAATAAIVAQLRKDNPDATVPVPIDLATSSGSGIDPEISPQAAEYQAPRVAAARHLPLARVERLIAASERGPALGFLGDPRINVLALNLALDDAK